MQRQDLRSWIVLVVVLVAAGCAASQPDSPPTGDTAGLSRDEVCDRFITGLGDAGMIRLSHGSGGVTSPPEAAQHLDDVETFREFGRWARNAQDPAQVDLGVRIEQEAETVARELSPDDSDRKAERVTDPLYRATAELYYDCQRELYQELLRSGGAEMTGACAEPGAPKLEGPNVMVYGSNGMFVDPTCELVQGDRVGDGCGFSNQEDSAPAGGGAHGSVEVAFDPDTCRALFERGRVKPGG